MFRLNLSERGNHMNDFVEKEVERYLRTGEYDQNFLQWPGDDFVARSTNQHTTLCNALISAVRQRTPNALVPDVLVGKDMTAHTRSKVAPMVSGLFQEGEVETVLDVLARSVVFLTPDTIYTVLQEMPWLGTSWDLANLYLASYAAEPLAGDAPELVGLSSETTCYVSIDYFTDQTRFSDYVVHEAAHIFHNCKRETIGLPSTRRKEWLLDIEYAKRETFAYSCEAYSRILELADGRAARRTLLSEIGDESPPDDRVDGSEYRDILREAVDARNGWKRILARCAPRPKNRSLAANAN